MAKRTTRTTKSGKTTKASARGKGKGKASAATASAATPAPTSGGGGGGGGGGGVLTLEQAIAMLKTTRPTFYRWLRAGKVKGMKVGRQWRFKREDLERFMQGEGPRIDLPVGTDDLMADLAKAIRDAGVKKSDMTGSDADDPIADAVMRMIHLGHASRASDVHVQPAKEPGIEPGEAQVRLRIDGALHTKLTFDLRLLPAVVAGWKRLASCDLNTTNLPQDGRALLKVAGDQLDLRVNFLPALHGEAVTARLLNPSAQRFKLADLPFCPADREVMQRAIGSAFGLIVATGPTGSGKTTTVYACLNELNEPHLKLVTVEDPVEYAFPGVVQVPVRPQHGVTYERAVRAILRSDPDVVMIGEIRNVETLQLALQVALTGHLALTQLHTNSAAGALVRMLDMGADPFVVGEAGRLIIGQRLVRRLCTKCAKPCEPDATQLAHAKKLASDGGLAWGTLPGKFHRAVGCAECGQTGYRGRLPINELLEVTGPIAAALREGVDEAGLTRLAVSQGMTTLAADAVRRAANGETSLDEALGVVS